MGRVTGGPLSTRPSKSTRLFLPYAVSQSSRSADNFVVHGICSRDGGRLASPLQTVIGRGRCVGDLCAALLIPGRTSRERYRRLNAAVAGRVRGR
jgi:hypothetical protein